MAIVLGIALVLSGFLGGSITGGLFMQDKYDRSLRVCEAAMAAKKRPLPNQECTYIPNYRLKGR